MTLHIWSYQGHLYLQSEGLCAVQAAVHPAKVIDELWWTGQRVGRTDWSLPVLQHDFRHLNMLQILHRGLGITPKIY